MDNNEEIMTTKTGVELAEDITNQFSSTLSPEDIAKLGVQFINLYASFSLMEKAVKDEESLERIAYTKEMLRMGIANALNGKCFEINLDDVKVSEVKKVEPKVEDEGKTEDKDEAEDDTSFDDEELEGYRESQNLTRENARRAVSLMSDVEVSNLATQLVSIFLETSQMKNLAKNALQAATYKFVNKLVKLNIRIALNGRRLSVLEPQNCRTLVVLENQEDKKGDKNNE